MRISTSSYPTWSRGDQKSATDFMLGNECVYEKCKSMPVDEGKEIVLVIIVW